MCKRATRKRKGSMQVKRPIKVKGPTEVKGPTQVNFKQGRGKNKFSLAPLTNLSPALTLSK